jgi:predicted N-acyltransferase
VDGRLVRSLPRGRRLSAAKTYELRLHTSVKDIPRAEWDALAESDPSPFVEWTWLDCLEESGCVGEGTGWTPVHFTLYQDKQLIAVAPAYAKMNSEGEFVFDWAWADASHRAGIPYYPKLILAVPFTPATGRRVLVAPGADVTEVVSVMGAATRKWLKETEVSGAHVLFPVEEELAGWKEAGFTERYGVQYHWQRKGATSMESFLARFNSKRRNQLKREMAQPKKDAITISTLQPHELTPAVVRTMFELYAINVDKHYYGRRYLKPRFFELVAERFAHRLAWVVARHEGRIVAGAFNVRKGNRLYGRYWGSTIEFPFLHFNVCYYEGIRYCLEQGIDAFEPGAGGEHKKVRGFDPTLTRSAHYVADPRLRRAINDFLARERAAIAEYIAHPE